MNDKAEPATPELENLIDGKVIDVKKTDGSTEKMRVRKIPIFDMEPLGRTFGKYVGEAALYLGTDEKFVRTLTEDSFGTVIEEGRKINFPSFKRWWGWQEQTLDGLGERENQDALISRVVDNLRKADQSASGNASSSS